MMPGRRYSEGLHQALEAKEHVQVQPENLTLASITFQNYFRLYDKLAGMTGTALTEADEFAEIYKLDVVEIPTNRPVERIDEDDEVYRTGEEKLQRRSSREIEDCQRQAAADAGRHHVDREIRAARRAAEEAQGYQADRLHRADGAEKLYAAARSGKPSKLFAVLNARFHEQEAYIVAQAGVPGADHHRHQHGRPRHRHPARRQRRDARRDRNAPACREGTERDAKEAEIRAEVARRKEKAIAAGGLYIIGTERHESRRIDNQLRGRSGRQGDPGASKFFLVAAKTI